MLLNNIPYQRLLVAAATLATGSMSFAVDGPGFTQPEGESPGAILHTWELGGGGGRTTTAGFHRGYLFTDTRGNTGIQTWDISDWGNPIRLEETEGKGTNHHHFLIDDYYLNASGGANEYGPSETARVWDFSDMTNIAEISPPEFPWIRRGGNKRRDWFTLPYVYTGQNGYHPPQPLGQIVDARDDTVLATLDYEAELGFPGQPLAIGNLLIVAASFTSSGVATYDVSDPTNPVLLDVIKNSAGTFIGTGYEPAIWRHYVVLAMDQFGNSPDRVTLIDFSDPTNLKLAGTVEAPPGLSRYTQFQDEYMFVGDSKYDLEALIADADQHFDSNDAVLTFNGQDEYLLPLGNVVATFSPGGTTSRFIVHDSEPDRKGPYVSYHNPRDGETDLPTTTRIGLVINETLDTSTIDEANVIVRPIDGDPVSGTLSWTDKDVLTFHPDEDLLDDTTYQVFFPADGLKDVSGNGIEAFSFTFSTGPFLADVEYPPSVTSLDFDYPVLTGEATDITVNAEDPDGDAPLEYRFDLGDGEVTDWSASNTVNVSFDSPGHKNIVVNIRDEQDLVTTRAFAVTVVDEVPAGPKPRNSSPILFDPDTDLVWVVNPDNDTIAAVDAVSLVKTAEIPVGEQPQSIAIDSTGMLWVTNERGDSVQVVDPVSGVVETISLGYGSRPFGVVCDSNDQVFVALEGRGEVVKIDGPTGAVLARVPVGPSPRALALDATESRLLVTRFISSDAGGEVWELAANDLSVTRTYDLRTETDPALDTGNNGRGVPNYLAGLAISPDNTTAIVPAKKDNIFAGLARDGTELAPDTTVRAIAPLLDLSAGAEDFDLRIDLDNSSQPSAAWFSPLGDYAFVLMQGNNEINVVDRLDGSRLATRILTGLAPQGLVYDHERGQLFTKDFMDRTVSVFDIDAYLRTGATPVVRTQAISTVSYERLSPNVLSGKRIFYNADDDRMSIDDYISCAACHLDGGHDGRTWDFTQRGEGIRNNISLRGRRGDGHGNVHWTANFDEIQDFENDIRLHFGGEGFLSDADFEATQDPLGQAKAGRSPALDDLADYLESLRADSGHRSPYRNPDGSMTDSARRGELVFQSMDCASCHSGPEFTDRRLHDIGTLKDASGTRLGQPLTGIETPTLADLHDTAPYLHDGSAATLHDVFDQFEPGGAHDVSALTDDDRDSLVDYLLQLEFEESELNRLYENDFGDNDLAEWIVVRGSDWDAENGAVQYGANNGAWPPDASTANVLAYNGGSDWSNYTFQFDMITGDDDLVGAVFYYRDPSNYLGLYSRLEQNELILFQVANGETTVLEQAEGTYGRDVTETFEITVENGGEIVARLGSTSLTASTPSSFSRGSIGFMTNYQENIRFDNVTVDPAGSAPPLDIRSESNGTIAIEAENGALGANWMVVQDGAASGDAYLEVAPEFDDANGAPECTSPECVATYEFESTTANGNYAFWFLTRSSGGADDSFFWRIDDGDWQIENGRAGDGNWHRRDNAMVDQLAPGVHTLQITYRENGMRLDKFLVQLDSADDPSGNGPEEVLGSEPNNPPLAIAGPDQSLIDSDGDGLESVTLDGGASFDTGGEITGYRWEVGGVEVASGVNPTLDFGLGVHHVVLRVADGDGATSSDTVVVSVSEVENGYENWMGEAFTEAQRQDPAFVDPMSTPFHDGVANALKYFYGIDPSRPMTAAERRGLVRSRVTMDNGQMSLVLRFCQAGDVPDSAIRFLTGPSLPPENPTTPDGDQIVGTDPGTGHPIREVTFIQPGPEPVFGAIEVVAE